MNIFFYDLCCSFCKQAEMYIRPDIHHITEYPNLYCIFVNNHSTTDTTFLMNTNNVLQLHNVLILLYDISHPRPGL